MKEIAKENLQVGDTLLALDMPAINHKKLVKITKWFTRHGYDASINYFSGSTMVYIGKSLGLAIMPNLGVSIFIAGGASVFIGYFAQVEQIWSLAQSLGFATNPYLNTGAEDKG